MLLRHCDILVSALLGEQAVGNSMKKRIQREPVCRAAPSSPPQLQKRNAYGYFLEPAYERQKKFAHYLPQPVFHRYYSCHLNPTRVQTASWGCINTTSHTVATPIWRRRKPPQDAHHHGERKADRPTSFALAKLPAPRKRHRPRDGMKTMACPSHLGRNAPRFLHSPLRRGRARLAGKPGER